MRKTKVNCLFIKNLISLAPGTYSPEKVNLNKGPEYSLYGKGLLEKPNDNPGMVIFLSP